MIVTWASLQCGHPSALAPTDQLRPIFLQPLPTPWQEAYAGYGGPDPVQATTAYQDTAWMLGDALKPLAPGVDCPVNAALLDLAATANSGAPVTTRWVAGFWVGGWGAPDGSVVLKQQTSRRLDVEYMYSQILLLWLLLTAST